MTFVTDADVIIRSWRDLYPRDVFPGYWQWVEQLMFQLVVRIPVDVFGEIREPRELREWLRGIKTRQPRLTIDHAEVRGACQRRVAEHVACRYEEAFARPFLDGGDYWLVCSALSVGGTVVTMEAPNRPSPSVGGRYRSAVKVPNICDDLKIPWLHLPEFLRRAGLRL